MALKQELKANSLNTIFFFPENLNRTSCLPKTASVALRQLSFHLILQPLIFYFYFSQKIPEQMTSNQLNMYGNKHKHAEKQMKQIHNIFSVFLKWIFHTYILLMFISDHSSFLLNSFLLQNADFLEKIEKEVQECLEFNSTPWLCGFPHTLWKVFVFSFECKLRFSFREKGIPRIESPQKSCYSADRQSEFCTVQSEHKLQIVIPQSKHQDWIASLHTSAASVGPGWSCWTHKSSRLVGSFHRDQKKGLLLIKDDL